MKKLLFLSILFCAISNLKAQTSETFSFDNIVNWTGEGENQAALVIQWYGEEAPNALAFGYMWDGSATLYDALCAIAKSDSRFYFAISNSYGISIAGIGWDADEDGEIAVINSATSSYYEPEEGVITVSGNYYGNLSAADGEDYWTSDPSNYSYYLSYFKKSSAESSWSNGGYDPSSITLSNGYWYGLRYGSSWKTIVAAPSLIPEGTTTQFKVNGLYYTLKNYSQKTVAISAPFELEGETYTSYSGDITVPSTFVYDNVTYTVVEVANEAFANTDVTKIVLPETITKIGKYAFQNSKLTDVNISDKISSIGDGAFSGCKGITKVNLPSTITEIPVELYKGTGLTELIFDGNINGIGNRAFAECVSLKTLSLGSTITTIGESAFSGCSALTELLIPTNIKTISSKSFDGCDGLTKVVCNNIVPVSITDDVFSTLTYNNAKLYVPVGYKSEYANSSGWKNFTNVEEVAISVNVGDYFYNGNVAYQITALSDNLNTVEVRHFHVDSYSEKNLKAANKAGYVGDVVIPEKVWYQNIEFTVAGIRNRAFIGATEMTSIKFNNPMDILPDSVLHGCTSLTTVQLPEGLKSIGDYSLYQCKALTSIELNENLTSIGKYAFNTCSKLSTVTLPSTLQSIDEFAFGSCSALSSINFPEGLLSIEKYGFSSTGLTSVKLPESIQTIGAYAFTSCKSLESIELPESMTEIPDNMLQWCTALNSVKLSSKLEKIGNTVFGGCTALTSISLPETLKSIGTYAFGQTGLVELTLPKSITEIPMQLLQSCTSLVKVTIKGTVTSIGMRAFQGCSLLENLVFADAETTETGKIVIPESVSKIDQYAFNSCPKISSFTFPENNTEIAGYVLQKCTGLVEVIMGDKVTSLNGYAFDGCTSLASIKISPILNTIGISAFNGCSQLKTLVIPEGIEKLNYRTIWGCSDVIVYMCNSVPCAWNTSTCNFGIGTDTYAPVVVPYGAKSAYEADATWALSEISEIVPSITIDMENNIENVTESIVEINVPVVLTYNEDIPELFKIANDVVVKQNIVVAVKYRKESASQDEFSEVIAKQLENGTYQVVITENLENSTTYEYYWSVKLDENEPIMSVSDTFVTGTSVGIEDIEAENISNTEYFNLQGVKVDSQNMGVGIYIKKQGNKTQKIIVR